MGSDADLIIYGGSAGCLDEHTEFLTRTGWKKISEYCEGEEVLQYDLETGYANFTLPLNYIKKPSDGFYELKTPRGLNQKLSKEHTVITLSKSGKVKKTVAEDFFGKHRESALGLKDGFITTYQYKGEDTNIPSEELRLQVALKADGSLITESTGRWRVNLKKKRKKDRLESLLQANSVEYRTRECGDFTHYELNYKPYGLTKDFSDWWFVSKRDAEVIVDELRYWDSYYKPKGNRLPSFFTTNKEDADVVQHLFNICGYRASISIDDRVGETQGKYTRKSVCYSVIPTVQTVLNLERKPGKKVEVPFIPPVQGEYKYCFTVPSGAFVARREGDIFITGNSGKSHLLLMHCLKYIDDPDFHCVYFRKVTSQLTGSGGLWPESLKMYSPFKTKTRTKPAHQHTFPSGATAMFMHMQHEDNKTDHQGLQLN